MEVWRHTGERKVEGGGVRLSAASCGCARRSCRERTGPGAMQATVADEPSSPLADDEALSRVRALRSCLSTPKTR